jgi:hypothetical protein
LPAYQPTLSCHPILKVFVLSSFVVLFSSSLLSLFFFYFLRIVSVEFLAADVVSVVSGVAISSVLFSAVDAFSDVD